VEYVAQQFSGGSRFLDDLPQERLTEEENEVASAKAKVQT
jgi:hypothetical protein